MKNFLWAVFGVSIGLIAIAVFGLTFNYAIQNEQLGGAFGDTFGVATSFFSMLTLVFLVIAVVLQRKEVGLVREERDDTKKLLESQKGLNALQAEALRIRSFEQSFFSSIGMLREQSLFLEKDFDPRGNVTGSNWDLATQSSISVLRAFSADPHERVELQQKLGPHAQQVCFFIETFLALNEMLDNLETQNTPTLHYKRILTSFNSEPVATCTLAYLVSSVLENPTLPYDDILDESGLSEYVTEGLDEPCSYFTIARSFPQ